jgi:hypothetical protein
MSVQVQSATDPRLTVSKDRCEPGSVNIPVATWPRTAESTSEDPNAIARKVLDGFNTAIKNDDTKAIAELFLDDGYWRDHLAITWDYYTAKSKEKIAEFLAQNGCSLTSIELDDDSAYKAPQFAAFDAAGEVKGLQFFFTFTSKLGKGRGMARLAETHGAWKIFTFFTTLSDLNGHEEGTGLNRPAGVQHGGQINRKNWQERRRDELDMNDRDPVVLIVGTYHTRDAIRCVC